jgi:hypothetical protein
VEAYWSWLLTADGIGIGCSAGGCELQLDYATVSLRLMFERVKTVSFHSHHPTAAATTANSLPGASYQLL